MISVMTLIRLMQLAKINLYSLNNQMVPLKHTIFRFLINLCLLDVNIVYCAVWLQSFFKDSISLFVFAKYCVIRNELFYG